MPILGPWPSDIEPRKWQEQGRRAFDEHSGPNFLVSSTPGSGKTKFGLMIAHALLFEGTVKRLVVVCPSSHLRRQWADVAHGVGIELDPEWENRQMTEAQDYHGVVITYQQVSSQPIVSRVACQVPTAVIFDEPHHMGEDKRWGEGGREAFEPAVSRLFLTGTPFRSDNNPIPFVTYDEKGVCKPDFRYSYADALADGVCRPVLFPYFEGRMEWLSDGEIIQATFDDELSRRLAAQRLLTAISASGEWLRTVIGEADYKLTEIRNDGHADAGGLILAKDQWHAINVAKLVESTTGEAPILAISDDPDASKHIKRFEEGRYRWLVAVKMVSEGVDIPRLRVGIYATNTITELFFRQVLGRFVRSLGMEEESAYLYLPRVAELVKYAQRVKEERDHQLQEEEEKIKRERAEVERSTGDYGFLSSEGWEGGTVYDAERYSPEEMRWANAFKRRHNYQLPPGIFAKMRREITGEVLTRPTSALPTSRGEVEPPRYEQKEGRKKTVKRLVAQLKEASGLDYRDINAWLVRETGVKREKATTEQLNQCVELLVARLKEFGCRPINDSSMTA